MSTGLVNIPLTAKFLEDDGTVSRPWRLWLMNPNFQTAAVVGSFTLNGTIIPIANGGTGAVIPSAAFNALSPITSVGDVILGIGTNSAGRLPIGTNGQVLTSDGTTASWSTPSTAATVSNNVNSTTSIAADTSYTLLGYLNLNATLNLNGNLGII